MKESRTAPVVAYDKNRIFNPLLSVTAVKDAIQEKPDGTCCHLNWIEKIKDGQGPQSLWRQPPMGRFRSKEGANGQSYQKSQVKGHLNERICDN